MKNKAFTLIELLAIIVILSIIAMITFPIILNIIENSKKNAITNSAYGYKDAVNKYYVMQLKKNGNFKFDGEYTINEEGNLEKNNEEYIIEISGKRPNNGTLIYKDNIIIEGCMAIDNYKVEIEKGKAKQATEGKC